MLSGPRENTFFVAKERGLEIGGRNGGAIEHHKRPRCALGVGMNGARQCGLAGACFTLNEQRNVAVQRQGQLVHHGVHQGVSRAQGGQALQRGDECG